ncbi:hypothetical protein [Psychroflexus salis]|uniref:SGNH/GDSL hydrolase family protein n=1 Tax=Psychroflexus salis TaxID=1526574 RepID=A0A917E6Y0_9FLAO|nr:hypothetical protein [Psychroflexus salis]GGE10737.1 hypothetical protein GCM10010831_10260 [Psychroflexus salis]
MSDSLALARPIPEVCEYKETWPSLLRAKGYFNIHQVSIGGATSKEILKQVHYHKMFYPDIVILQVGIVDCVPRFMSRLELDISYSLGNLGKKIRAFCNKKSIRKYRKISYVNENEFKSNLIKFKSHFENSKIIVLGIIPAADEYEKLVPGVKDKIENYNHIIFNTFKNVIKTDNVVLQNGLMSDQHHLNAKGHNILFNQIIKVID